MIGEPAERLRTSERWPRPARILHWSVACLVPLQLWLGWAADAAPDRSAAFRLISAHFQLGCSIFVLMVLRLSWRIVKGRPPAINPEPAWRGLFAGGLHGSLYALLLILPVSGYVIWIWMDAPRFWLGLIELPKLFDPPGDDESSRALAWYIHHYCAYAMMGLTLLHIAVALWRELLWRDGVIRRRML